MWDTEARALSINVYPVPLLLEQGNMEPCSGGALEMVSVPVGLPGAQPALQGTILLRAVQYVCPSNLPLRISSRLCWDGGVTGLSSPFPSSYREVGCAGRSAGASWQRAGSHGFILRPLVKSTSLRLCKDFPVLVGSRGPGGEERHHLSLG